MAVGKYALYNNSNANGESGSQNTAVGDSSLINIIVGFDNTAIGYHANVGNEGTYGLSYGSTAIGAWAEVDASDAIVLGGKDPYNGNIYPNVGIGTNAPTHKLEVNGTTYLNGQVTVIGSGTYTGTWTSSDQMFKTNVDSLHNALALIKKLKPKTYYFDTLNYSEFSFSSKKQYGFIAQDLEQVLPELIKPTEKKADVDTSGNIIHPAITFKAVNYIELIAFLTKGIQGIAVKK